MLPVCGKKRKILEVHLFVIVEIGPADIILLKPIIAEHRKVSNINVSIIVEVTDNRNVIVPQRDGRGGLILRHIVIVV